PVSQSGKITELERAKRRTRNGKRLGVFMPHDDDFEELIARLLSGFPVVVRQNVIWGEMDAYNHVNNVVYFRYFENARLEYMARLDWFNYEKETGIGPILS